MVNFKLDDKCDKDEIINMTRVPDGNRTHDLPDTGRVLYSLSHEYLRRVYCSCITRVLHTARNSDVEVVVVNDK